MTDIQLVSSNILMALYLDEKSGFTKEECSIFSKFKMQLGEDDSVLYILNKIILEKQGQLDVQELGMKFRYISGENIIELVTNYGTLCMEAEKFRKVVAASISIYEEILPLGSIVDLDEDMLRLMGDINEVKSIRVMITHRMIPNGHDDYIAYRGVYYPYGMIASEPDNISFTPKFIKNIVKLGYSDDENDRYLHSVKESYILEHDMHSYSVTSPEEFLTMKKMMNISN